MAKKIIRYLNERKVPLLFITPSLIILCFFLAALWALFILSFYKAGKLGVLQPGVTLDQYKRFFGDPFYCGYLYRSFSVSLYSTLAVLIIGYPTAYIMVRSTRTMKRFLTILLLIHFFSSYIMRMYAIMLIIGNNGLINRSLEYLHIVSKPVRIMYCELGVGIGLTTGVLAFMVFCISSVLEGIDRTFEEVALSLGASRIRIFFEVTLPLSLPGIAAGIVICFLYNLSGFVTPTLLGGGHFEMVANFVYEQAMQLLNYPFAAAGAFVLLFISLLLVYIINKVSEKMIKGVAKI